MIFRLRVAAAVVVVMFVALAGAALNFRAEHQVTTPPARPAPTRLMPAASPPLFEGFDVLVAQQAAISAANTQAWLDALHAAALPPAPAVEAPPVASRVEWPTSLQPCGADLPPCYVKQRESGGSYSARNNESAGSACGAWQIIQSTWNGYGGYPDACSAPPAVQDAKARELWADGAGCAHWSAC